MSFRLLFVANDFALREQGVSRVNNAGGAADQAACVEKRNSARKSADIRYTSPAVARATPLGGANIASRQEAVVDRHSRSRTSCIGRRA